MVPGLENRVALVTGSFFDVGKSAEGTIGRSDASAASAQLPVNMSSVTYFVHVSISATLYRSVDKSK